MLRAGFRVHPDYSPGRVVLARLHLETGNRGLAVSVLEEVVRGDPANLAGGTLLARLLVEDGRTRDARPIIERLMMGASQDATVRALSAAIGARGAHATARGTDPFDSPALATRMVAAGAYDRALAIWRRIALAHADSLDVREHITELERAVLGLGNVEDEAARVAVRWTLPGALDLSAALGDDEGTRTAPAGSARFGALAAGLWRDP